jgi:ABC-type branched-subunit amino acid transport system substrate-binding protein
MDYHKPRSARFIVAFAALVAIGIGVDSSAFAQAASGEPVKIGVIVDKSSFLVSLSQGETEALQAGADAINKGRFFWGKPPATSGKPGILGRPIQFMLEDAQVDPNLALSKSRRLASLGAQAIVITTTSGEMLQARLVCEEAKIICIGPSVANIGIVKPPHNAYAFTLAPTFQMQGEAGVGALKAIKASAVAVVRDDSGSSKSQAQFFIDVMKAAGIKVTAEEIIPVGSREMAGQLLRIRDSKPDAVLDLVNPTVDGALFLKAYQSSGIGLPLLAQGGLISQPETWRLAGASIDGTIAVDYLSPSSTDANEFRDYFRSTYGADRPFLSTHVMPMTALLLLKRAMEDAGATSGEEVKAAMEKITKFPAGFGQAGYTINYTPDDHNGSTNKSMVVVEFAKGLPSKDWASYQPSAGN